MAVPFRLELHHVIKIVNEAGLEERSYIRKIRENGWTVEPFERPGDLVFLGGDRVLDAYLSGRFEYIALDERGLPPARLRRLQQTFESLPLHRKRKLERKHKIVRAVQKAVAGGMNLTSALDLIPARVVGLYSSQWLALDNAELVERHKAKILSGRIDPLTAMKPAKAFRVPTGRTVWTWIQQFVQAGCNIIGLIDGDGDKGRKRGQIPDEVDELAREHIKAHLPGKGRFRKVQVRKNLNQALKAAGLPEISQKAFDLRVSRLVGAEAELGAQVGKKAAARALSLSGTMRESPNVNDQVEIDHTLLNINVVHEPTGVILGRPWLTTVLECASRSISGAHLSFLPPQWATTSRALVHAMWPKDLTGFSGIQHAWNQYGIFEKAVTDRGIDFLSEAQRHSALVLGFDVENLPGYMPHLKGKIERTNRTIKFEVLNYEDGIASSKDPNYDGSRNASVGYEELAEFLVGLFVDDMNWKPHGGIRGAIPGQIWQDGMDRLGSPRPAASANLRRIACIPSMHSIQPSRGIELKGYLYKDPRLGEILGRRGAKGRKFQVLSDPYDMGYVEVLDDMEGGFGWFVCRCTRPDLTDGVTRYQDSLHWDYAKFLNDGHQPSYEHVRRAKEVLEDQVDQVTSIGRRMREAGLQISFARYFEIGDFLTPIKLAPATPEKRPNFIRGWLEQHGIWTPQSTGGVALPPPVETLAAIEQLRASLERKPLVLDGGGALRIEDLDAELEASWGNRA